jgi:Sec1-binding region of Mso1
MASYLTYFSSNNSPSQSHQQRPATPSSTSWSSAFSSRVALLRRALTKDSEEDDTENEDCSHVSNVLRAYYTEKGRAFPDWLPPDPRKPTPVVAQQQSQYGQYGNSYGGYGGTQYGSQQAHDKGGAVGRGGLSDLWDPAPARPTSTGPQSLRAPRPSAQVLRSHDTNSSVGSTSSTRTLPSQQTSSARPLPSQMAGSIQNANTGALGSRDRLRARMQGGERSNSGFGTAGIQQSGSYNSQLSSEGTSPYVSASEPWSSGAADYGYGGGYTSAPSSGQYGSSSNPRQRAPGFR